MAFDITLFFNNDKFSDVTISFSGRKMKCHKMILCTKSKYFNSSFGPDSKFSESEQKEIPLEGGPPDAVEAMLADLYDLDYSERFEDEAKDPGFHHDVIITARKYLMSELEEKAVDAFRRTIPLVTDIAAIRALIDKHVNRELDELVPTTEEQHLSKLMRTQEYPQKFASDARLRQVVIARCSFVESLIERHFIRCYSCNKDNFPDPIRVDYGGRGRLLTIRDAFQNPNSGQTVSYWMEKI